VSQYWLYIGTTAGAANLVNRDTGTSLSTTVGLPSDGSTLYVRLWSLTATGWQYNDYAYTATTRIAGLQRHLQWVISDTGRVALHARDDELDGLLQERLASMLHVSV
jgi:hypothetical protein